MGVGLAILGVSGPLIYIPILPELITIMNNKNKHLRDDPKLMDMCSGIYNGAINLGFWMTPIISGTLAEWNGYQYTCDSMAFISCSFGFFFFAVLMYKEKYLKPKHQYVLPMKKELEVTHISIDDI